MVSKDVAIRPWYFVRV